MRDAQAGFDLVNTHTTVGAEMLSGSTFDLVATAEEIALTHVRPYKPAWVVVDAEAEVRNQAGRHFDPEVVDAFFSARREPRPALAGASLTAC